MNRDVEFAEYASARWPRLVRAALLLGCPVPDAEDAAQNTLERCLRHWGKVEAAADRDAYVHRMLVNSVMTFRRRRAWRVERATESLPEVLLDDVTGAADDAEVIRAALLRLSEQHRAVVVLRFYADLSEAQTAAVLGVPPGTVKSRLSRALIALASDPNLGLSMKGLS